MIGQRGFTLIEMMVSILLTSMVILGLASIFSAVYRFEVAGYQRDVIQGGAVMSFNSLVQDVRQTTMFSMPAPPCPSGICTSGAGVDSDGTTTVRRTIG